MSSETPGDEAEAAGQLIAYGFRPKLAPSRDEVYAALVKRFLEEPDFEQLVKRYATGLGMKVLDVSTRAGMVHAALPGSVFETRTEQYARQARLGQHRTAERVLHGITHLAIAALCFPRQEDLPDDGQVGRVRASEVDQYVRTVCEALEQRATQDGEDPDPPADASDLERVWHAYQRRPEVARTKKGRPGVSSTRGAAHRALAYLVERGMLREAGTDPERGEKNYVSTFRYKLHVRELAATRAYQELLKLGIPPPSDTDGLRRTDETKLYD